MAAQRGKDLLIKLDATGSGAFETVAGLRATRIGFNADVVDATSAESVGRWRELLAGAGARSCQVTGSGIFRDAASDAAIRSAFFEGRAPALELVIPDFGTVRGPFEITALEYAGEHDGEATFEVALASAGALAFEAAT